MATAQQRYRGKHILFDVWGNMVGRCTNEKNPRYNGYGGRGIKVCERWRKFKNFEEDMLESYKKGLQLDRIDNDGDYCPENCKWSTPKEQSNNRRDNFNVTYNGLTMTIPRWARKLGIKRSTLGMRIYKYGWSIEKSLTTN